MNPHITVFYRKSDGFVYELVTEYETLDEALLVADWLQWHINEGQSNIEFITVTDAKEKIVDIKNKY